MWIQVTSLIPQQLTRHDNMPGRTIWTIAEHSNHGERFQFIRLGCSPVSTDNTWQQSLSHCPPGASILVRTQSFISIFIPRPSGQQTELNRQAAERTWPLGFRMGTSVENECFSQAFALSRFHLPGKVHTQLVCHCHSYQTRAVSELARLI